MKRKINVVTLGCSKNLVDSEHLMAQLERQNLEVVHDSNDPAARTVVINTCGFIGDAKEESINTILSFAEARTRGDIDHLFVMGCLSERYRDELAAEIPEVDRMFGVRDLADVVRAVGAEYRTELAGERRLTTPSHYAYLKISEGCNWGCGYCAIPLIRGRHVSVPMEALVAEAEGLAARGVKELIVIAQDTTYYGLDLYGRRALADLLRRLCRIDGIEWVRLHYAYPAHFPDEVIDLLRDEPKMCPYLDIPLQHVADSQLKAMRRGIDGAGTRALVRRLREQVPGIAIRTTLIVGYPGESEADFAELLDFVREMRFERLGVFAYCEEEGTHSALHLQDDIPEEEKQRRVDAVMSLQREISLGNNRGRVGRTEPVIIDRAEGDYYVGRTRHDSPEVDDEVLVSSPEPLAPGTILSVRITGADDYDLYGTPAGE
ncbi:MAG: 30S ribosomal protein S12 methylthiotransferase RimO [Rikenellaceae bacterium]|nr:30S ribosomal protein S12 methylthiotransferase RimO [Rikenellaceae bacterium]